MKTATKTEKPILFSTEMVQAILDGRKTQTRRVVTPNNTIGFAQKKKFLDFSTIYPNETLGVKVPELKTDRVWRGYCKWEKDSEIWVRETWRPISWRPNDWWWKIQYKTGDDVVFRDQLYPPENPKDQELCIRLHDEIKEKRSAKMEREGTSSPTGSIKEYLAWKPSIHMPRGASRIQLTVEDIRVERVQEISEEDALAEGVQVDDSNHAIRPDDDINWGGPIGRFAELWDSINADRGYSWKSNPWVWVVEFSVKEIKQ
jgi:hypothetical protein